MGLFANQTQQFEKWCQQLLYNHGPSWRAFVRIRIRKRVAGGDAVTEPEWKRRLTDLLELPADVTLDLPRVQIIGQIHLTVENHRGLVEYSDQRVIIGVPTGRLVVQGDDLAIGFINAEEVTVLGLIRGVHFAGTGAAGAGTAAGPGRAAGPPPTEGAS